jgi:hypothetical protein
VAQKMDIQVSTYRSSNDQLDKGLEGTDQAMKKVLIKKKEAQST